MGTSRVSYLFTYYATPGWNYNLIQCTGTIDSGNNTILSADFKNVNFKIIHCTGLKRRADSFKATSLPFRQ